MSKANATLYRMDMPGHLCPSGLKARWLLQSKGYDLSDNRLLSREDTDAFKAKHKVKTTPQIWIDGEHVGGYSDLRVKLGIDPANKAETTTYLPVIMLFSIAALLAVAVSYLLGTLLSVRTLELFVPFAMVLLALQKLQDVERFSTSFLNYDLLAQRWVPYAYIYPFAEGLTGLLMIAGVLMWFAAPVMLFIGIIGAVSVYKAVYVDKRDIKCACVGGGSRVPLGFVSLTENLIMMAMAIWGLSKMLF